MVTMLLGWLQRVIKVRTTTVTCQAPDTICWSDLKGGFLLLNNQSRASERLPGWDPDPASQTRTLLLVQSPDFTSIPLALSLVQGGMTFLFHLTWRWKDYNILKLPGTEEWLKKQQIHFPTSANKVGSWLGTLKRKQGNSKKQTVQLQTQACQFCSLLGGRSIS